MTDKISIKASSVTFFLCGIFMILCGCMNPVDIPGLLEDPIVINIIEASEGKVEIYPGSENPGGGALIPGNGRISGLARNYYYRVEEYDEDKEFQQNFFVDTDGNIWDGLSGIGRLAGDQILGLKNKYYYKVVPAKLFSTGQSECFTLTGTADNPVSITNGAVTIIRPNTGIYYLNLAPEISVNNDYEVIKKHISGVNTSWGDFRTSAFYIGSGPSIGIANIQNDSYYQKFRARTIGIYQYRKEVSTGGGVPLLDKSIIALPDADTQSDYVFAEYDSEDKITKFTVLTVERMEIKTPVATDYTFGNLNQKAGSVTDVTITPQSGKSSGARTIYYEGTSGTTYAKSTTVPQLAGTYTVTFDVAAAPGWEEKTGLAAGTLTVVNQAPVAADYTFGNLNQNTGSVTDVTITPQSGKSSGARTIYYEGTSGTTYAKSTTVPQLAGTYAVTFDVAAVTYWNAASGLVAGTLIITNPSVKLGVIVSLTSENSPQVSVTPASISQNSSGAVTVAVTNSGSYSSFAWYMDGVLQTSTGNTFTFNMSSINHQMVGVYNITVVGKTAGNMSYSTQVTITVE
jgi:hypothetical protein